MCKMRSSVIHFFNVETMIIMILLVVWNVFLSTSYYYSYAMESCHLQTETVFNLGELSDGVHEDSFCLTVIPSIPSFGILNERIDSFVPHVQSFVSIALPEMHNDIMVSDSLCEKSNQDCLSTESSCLNSVESISSSWYISSMALMVAISQWQRLKAKIRSNSKDRNAVVRIGSVFPL